MSAHETAARASMTAGVDPFVFEIIRHKLFRVTEEAAIALENASGTSITTEGHDLMVSLYRANGSLMVGGSGFIQHITSASQAVKHVIALFSDSPGFHEDDVYLFNDPYSGALHAPDIYLIAPIHSDGELAGFVAGFVHVHDIGGIDPGGFCPSARSSFQEGFATQGIKLVERGSTRPDVLGTFLNMVRDPSIVALDVKSLLAAIHVAKERMRSLYRTYGVQTVESVSSALVAQSEHLFRSRLTELPNGCWRARTYYEQPDHAMRIHLAMTKQGDSVTFDFSGTDEQVPFGVNCSYWATWGSLFASLFVLVVPDLVWNDGIIAPVRLIAPEGTLINARRPAPVSMATIAMVQTVRNLSVLVISKMLGASTSLRHQATGPGRRRTSHTISRTSATAPLSTEQTSTRVGRRAGHTRRPRPGWSDPRPRLALGQPRATRGRLPLPLPLPPAGDGLRWAGQVRGGMCHEYALVGHGSAGQLEAVLMPGRGGRPPSLTASSEAIPAATPRRFGFASPTRIDWPHDLASTSGRHLDQLGMGITELAPTTCSTSDMMAPGAMATRSSASPAPCCATCLPGW